MKNKKSFGEFFKACRIANRETLRQFCFENRLDPLIISKLERGLLPPPQSREKLEKYAGYLKIKKGSDDWYTFFDLAAEEMTKILSEKLNEKLNSAYGNPISEALREEFIKFLETVISKSK